MYIQPNPYYTQPNFCPCCGRPLGYNPFYYNPWTTYGTTSGSTQAKGIPVQNSEKKEDT